jgi:hypothetical protein
VEAGAGAGAGAGVGPRGTTRAGRLLVMEDTLALLAAHSDWCDVGFLARSTGEGRRYRLFPPVRSQGRLLDGACRRVEVVEEDTLVCAARLVAAAGAPDPRYANGHGIAVLDMASALHPGGGYASGAGTCAA